MPSHRDSLATGEELVLELHPHVLSLAKPTAALVGATALGVLVLANLDLWQALDLILAAVVLVALLWFLLNVARWATTWFVLTSERVVIREGMVARKSREIPLASVTAVQVSQRVVERMAGLGDITVSSPAEDDDVTFANIRKPELVRRTINEEIAQQKDRDAARNRGPAPMMPMMMPGPAPTIPDQIAQLASLREQGVISEAEFQTKKADLLRRM